MILHFKARYLLFILVFLIARSSLSAQVCRLYTPKDGLSNSHVNAIYEDRVGFIWIATDYGLNRFDGKYFVKHEIVPDTTKFARTGKFHSICEDAAGNLLVGAERGLFMLDKNQGRLKPVVVADIPAVSTSHITCIFVDKNKNTWLAMAGYGISCIDTCFNKVKIPSSRLLPQIQYATSILESADGSIWVGTGNNGAFKFSDDLTEMVHYHKDAPENFRLSGNNISTIVEDQKHNILFGVFERGVDLLDHRTHVIRRTHLPSNDLRGLVHRITIDRNGRVLLGTDAAGVYMLDERDMSLRPYTVNVASLNLSKSKVHTIYEDRAGNTWLAVYQKGVVMISKEMEPFLFIGHDSYNHASFPDNCILAITQDDNHNLWIGTDGGGLVQYNLLTKRTQVYSTFSTPKFPDNVVTSVHFDNGVMWVGTYLNGVVKIDTKTGAMYRLHKDSRHPIQSNYINAITSSPDGRVWLGTGDLGLCVVEASGACQTLLELTGSQVSMGFIHALHITGSNLWVGTTKGLFRVDLLNNRVDLLVALNAKLLVSTVFCIKSDKDGNVWLGTSNGLACYNPYDGKVKILDAERVLNGEMLYAMEIDNANHIWGGTEKGIFKYLIDEQKFLFYTSYLGLQTNKFKVGASYIGSDSELFFGGTNGINYFSSLLEVSDRVIESVYLLGLSVDNQLIEPGKVYDGKVILPRAFPQTETIKLHHDQTNISIKFAALEFVSPERVLYRFRLDGLDSKWIYTDSESNTAHFTKIPPGAYTFRIQVSFDSDFANYAEDTLRIEISPPWWMSWWCKTLYTIMMFVAMYLLYSTVRRRIRIRNEMLEKKHQAEMMKTQLDSFVNISHELRTPLTLIIAPLKKLLKGEVNDPKQQYRPMLLNSQRMLDLADQLLDVHRISNGAMKLVFEQVDIINQINDLILSFESQFSEKQVAFSFVNKLNVRRFYTFPDIINKSVSNLLSNAMKFSPRGSTVSLTVSQSDELFYISVRDNGIGISKEEQTKIFDRFYQSESIGREGVGVGLHLTQSLVWQINGTIAVRSELGAGAEFIITLPLQDRTLGYNAKYQRPISEKELNDCKENEAHKVRSKSISRIVIVEDNDDIREYLKREISVYYKISDFSNAKDAYSFILSTADIDLIISDVIMPGIDGYELCKKIKNNSQTSDIPIIMLTAKVDDDSQIKGIKGGADDYIAKPFSIDILLAKIKNLADKHQLLRKKYTNNYHVDIVDHIKDFKGHEEKLIARFIDLVTTNIGDPDLHIEELSAQLGVSRISLYRKIKQTTGQAPATLIRDIRLKQAAYLLAKQAPIAEVAYLVGFNSHSHFSKLFNKHFGCSPTEYSRKEGETGSE